MSTPNTPASNDFVLVPREAITAVLARCEALEDEASNALENELTEHAVGFWRGQKSTSKSLRAQLHDATRSALAAAPASPEPASNEAPGRGGVEAFGAAVFRLSWDAFMDVQFDVDLERITKAAVEAGLLKVCPFDPEVHNDETGAAEAGDDFYQPTEAGCAILDQGADA